MDLPDLSKQVENQIAALFPQPTSAQPEFTIEEVDRDLLDRKVLLTYIHQYYAENNGTYPTMSAITYQTELTPERVTELSKSEKFEKALDTRGLPALIFEEADEFNPDFILAVNFIVDPSDKRTKQAKLKAIGKSTTWFNNMLRKSKYRDYYRNQVDTIFDEDTKIEAKAALSRLIANDDLAAIKHMQEYTGQFSPAQNQVASLTIIIQVLMEILARHVNSQTLAVIADEIEKSNILPQLGAAS